VLVRTLCQIVDSDLRRKSKGRQPTWREMSAELTRHGHVNTHSRPYAAKLVASMLASARPA
jgi:hypothetical protein